MADRFLVMADDMAVPILGAVVVGAVPIVAMIAALNVHESIEVCEEGDVKEKVCDDGSVITATCVDNDWVWDTHCPIEPLDPTQLVGFAVGMCALIAVFYGGPWAWEKFVKK